MLKTLFIVGAGSCIGGILRFLISKLIPSHSSLPLPLGTLLVNVTGCFLIGIFYAYFERNHMISNELRLFLTVGFCGGFTTFSTFINENFQLMKAEQFFVMFSYLALSLLGGLLMLYLGYTLVRSL